MLKKIVIIVTLVTLFTALQAENLAKKVTITLNNKLKKSTNILCCGTSGLIIWNTNKPYNSEHLVRFAEYVPYDSIIKIRTRNKINMTPFLVGLGTCATLILVGKSADDFSSFAKAFGLGILSFGVGSFVTIGSLILPRQHTPKEFLNNLKIINEYVIYTHNLPIELESYLLKHEGVNP